jgi:hypothetical protein
MSNPSTLKGAELDAAPRRIQLSRAKGWKMPPNTVKVDRTTKWGNPFKATDTYCTGPKQGQQAGVAGAVQAFRNALVNDLKRGKTARPQLDLLRGKNLACWCKLGEPCHADVLLELANGRQVRDERGRT